MTTVVEPDTEPREPLRRHDRFFFVTFVFLPLDLFLLFLRDFDRDFDRDEEEAAATGGSAATAYSAGMPSEKAATTAKVMARIRQRLMFLIIFSAILSIDVIIICEVLNYCPLTAITSTRATPSCITVTAVGKPLASR